MLLLLQVVLLLLSYDPSLRLELLSTDKADLQIIHNESSHQPSIENTTSIPMPTSDQEKIDTELKGNDDFTPTKENMYRNSRRRPCLVFVDVMLGWFFFIELSIKFITCPRKLQFFRNKFNVIDVLTIVPRTVLMIAYYDNEIYRVLIVQTWPIMYVKVVSILRVIRLANMSRHYVPARVFLTTIWESRNEIGLLLSLYVAGATIFASVLFFCEQTNPNDFPTMASGVWWAFITMTTVGYGDMYPRTELGKSVGVMCAFSGVVATALPVAVIATNYSVIYQTAILSNKFQKL